MAGKDAQAPAIARANTNSPRPRSVREEQQLLTRRRLLDASLRVFEANGYHGASVEEIVSVAGVTRSTFYLHFKNKAEILQVLTDAGRGRVAELYAELDAAIAGDDARDGDGDAGDIRPAVRQWLGKAIDWYAETDNQIIAAVWQELSVGVDSQVVRGIAVDEHLPRFLDRWPAAERDAARTRVILLSHLLSRAVLLSRRGVLPADEQVMLETLADLWTAGLTRPVTRS
jgi:AcrR family transcriptional regulator